MSKVDILLPVYNGAPFLKDSIESVLSQHFEDFRLIVIDDGSTDGSAEIARTFERRDNRITVKSKDNSGLVDTLNYGMEFVDAEFVARQDADDLSLPTRFGTQYRHLTYNDDTVATSCLHMKINDSRHLVETQRWGWNPMKYDATEIPAKEPCLPHPFMMMRTSKLRAAGGYRHVAHAEDADLWWRLVLLGKVTIIDEVLGVYRIHGDAVSSRAAWVQAVSSQLAALSFVRRITNRSELVFDRDRASAMKQAKSIDEALMVFRDQVSKEEYERLHTASNLKLLWSADLREFPLEATDISAAITAYMNRPKGVRINKEEVKRTIRHGLSRNWAQFGFFKGLKLLFYMLIVTKLGIRAWHVPAIRATRP